MLAWPLGEEKATPRGVGCEAATRKGGEVGVMWVSFDRIEVDLVWGSEC